MKTGADNLQRYISLRETLGLAAMLARWIIRIEMYLFSPSKYILIHSCSQAHMPGNF